MKHAILLIMVLLASLTLRAQTDEEGAAAGQMSPMMQQMQGHMQAMREQMAQIQATDDPEERERLMREHMASMHEGMDMMGRMMAGPMGRQRAAPACGDEDTGCRMERMQDRQSAMGQHMNMMRMMMDQMMQQMSEHQEGHHQSGEHQMPAEQE